jgi:phospholipase/carboxylesterase
MKRILNLALSLILISLLVFQCGSKKSDLGLKPEVKSYYEVRIPKDYDPAEPIPLVIALHGHGQNETQITSLWDNGIYYEPDFILLSIRGPFQAKDGYAWVVKSDTLLEDWNARRKASAQVCEKRIFDILDEFGERNTYDEDLIYLAGFSQGAMMALYIGLNNPDIFAGISAESGAYDTLMLPKTVLEDIEGIEVYLAAGREEDSRVIKAMRNTESLLSDAGARVMLYIHDGGHVITDVSCRKMQNFFALSLEDAPEEEGYYQSEDYGDEEEIPEYEYEEEDESDYQEE